VETEREVILPNIRVLIVDDHAILRDGIRTLLERQSNIEVVGEAPNGREAIFRVGELLPRPGSHSPYHRKIPPSADIDPDPAR
jgi:CheY-like chemotaxis protein